MSYFDNLPFIFPSVVSAALPKCLIRITPGLNKHYKHKNTVKYNNLHFGPPNQV